MKFWKNIFHSKLKSYLADPSSGKVIEAFKLDGKTYYQFDSSFDYPVHRALSATWIYEEMRMRANKEYLEKHIRAMELLLSPANNRWNIGAIALLNQNLKDRLELAPFPDHIYKLASVSYFDKDEDPRYYDQKHNEKKIAKWKASGGEALNFFCQRLLPELMPSLQHSGLDAQTYLESMEEVNQMHLRHLQGILSREN